MSGPAVFLLAAEEGGDVIDAKGPGDIFRDVYWLMMYFSILWIVGKISVKIALPSLVGEIIAGILLGPNFLDFVPYPSALKIIGDIGLLLLVLEAGVDVNMGILKVVGTRGLMIAVFGSMCPMTIGALLAYVVNPLVTPRTAIAIGACFAPTSMGIALNVLRNGNVLNTPTGQLIIAAAVLDDVIALMLLSVLSEFAEGEPTIIEIMIPIIVSPILIIFFGLIAIYVSPSVVKRIMDKIDIKYHEYAILLMLFGATLLLVPACFYSRSSYLLGAFLAGLMFCTDHTVHHCWEKQMKRIMHWMLRIFFSCTIGFEVPIKDFAEPKVATNSLLYFVAIIGKVLTGFFTQSKPMNLIDFCIISSSMSAWGEFAFILATQGYAAGLFDQNTKSEVLMAVLLSVIFAPWALRSTLRIGYHKKDMMITQQRESTINSIILSKSKRNVFSLTQLTESTVSPTPPYSSTSIDMSDVKYLHPVFYCIHTKTYGRWGHQDRLLKGLYRLKLEIIDYRAFNEAPDNYHHNKPFVQDVFYAKDNRLSLLPTKQLSKGSHHKLSKRLKEIRSSIKIALQDKNAKIIIMRWLPGIKRTDDIPSTPKTDRSKIGLMAPSYIKDEAYKQARAELSSFHLLNRHTIHVAHDKDNKYVNPLPRTEEHGPEFGHAEVGYLSRIHSGHDALVRNRVSYDGHGPIHRTDSDDLIKLNYPDITEHKKGDSDDIIDFSRSDKTDDDNIINMGILYGDGHGHDRHSSDTSKKSKDNKDIKNGDNKPIIGSTIKQYTKTPDTKTPLLKKEDSV